MTATAQTNQYQLIKPNECPADCLLIDVRTPVEFAEVHAKNASNIPLGSLDETKVKEIAEQAASKPIVILCQSGSRAKTAGKKLCDFGISNVHVIEGGTLGWQVANKPVIKSKASRLPLMRQVQVVIGAVVLTSSVLVILGQAWAAWIAAFVGAGLLFAGITGFCGLAILLSKMPWNRVDGAAPQKNCSI